MNADTEVERKIAVRNARAASRVMRAAGVPLGARGKDHAVADAYVDSEDRALLAAGYGLRVRRLPDGSHEATLKSLPSPGDAPTLDREERTAPLAGSRLDLRLLPDGALRARITELAGDRPLVPLARVRGRRREFELRPAPGLLVELNDDRVRLTAARRSVLHREIELELLDGSRSAYESWADGVASRAGARFSGVSKLERALRAARIPVPSPARVAARRLAIGRATGTDAPAAVAASQALARLALSLAPATEAARRGAVEGVHDVRTVSRRLRALLSAFRDEIRDDDRDDLRRRLRAMRRSAGSVRDLDILREALATPPKDADPAGVRALRAALTARRRRERGTLSEHLDSPRLKHLADRVAEVAARTIARGGPPFAVAGATRLPGQLAEMLSRRARIRGALRGAEPEALHALRIAAKRARYASETFAAAFGKPVATFAEAARALQDGLGEVQDARATSEGVRSLARSAARDPRVAPAATQAAAAFVSAARAKDERARKRLDALAEGVLSRRAVRALFDHLAKRAAAVVDAAR